MEDAAGPLPGKRTRNRMGEVHDYLTVTAFAGYRRNKAGEIQCALWRAKCRCGEEVVVEGSALGRTQKSCGRCWKGDRNRERITAASDAFRKTLIGLKKGRLTILDVFDQPSTLAGKPANRLMCMCKCECGNIKAIPWGKIQQREFPSCRCRNNELTSARCRKRGEENLEALSAQHVGRKVGRLTIAAVYRHPGKDPVWADADCACGKSWSGALSNLVGKKVRHTLSCGCYLLDKLRKRHQKYRMSKGFGSDQFMSLFAHSVMNAAQPLFRAIKRRERKCVLCGKGNLRTHHILPRKVDFSLERYIDPRNLVSLCKDCHIQVAHDGNVRGPVNPQVAERLSALAQAREDALDSSTLVDMDGIRDQIEKIRTIFCPTQSEGVGPVSPMAMLPGEVPSGSK